MMSEYRQLFSLCLLYALALPLQAAEIDKSDLIKVEKGKNTDCVEYYNYNGELYCSTKASRLQNPPGDLESMEMQTIVFDDREWKAAWGQKTDTITTIEYIPQGDNIEKWQELVTSQFIPGIQDKMTPKEFSQNVMKYLKESGLDPVIHVINESPDRVLFEFQVMEPENLKQDELQLITKGKDGMYVLHYVIKEAPMDKERREKWINLLNQSKPEKPQVKVE